MATITANTGSNNWNTNAAWVGSVQPTAADDVIIPASATVIIPISTNVYARSVTVQASGTVTQNLASATLNIGDATAGAGNVALSISASATWNTSGANGTIIFVSTSATQQTITTGGKTLTNMTFNGAGSSYVLGGALTASTITLNASTFDTANYSMTYVTFSVGAGGARTLTLGSSAITATSLGMTYGNLTSLTMTSTTAVITCTNTPASFNNLFVLNSFNWQGLSFVITGGGQGSLNIGGATIGSLTINSPANQTTAYRLNGGTGNFTCSAFNVTGNSTLNRPLISGGTTGTANTITAASTSLQDVDFMDITGAGAGAWTITGGVVGDWGGNTNITTTTPATQTRDSTGGQAWSVAARWTSRVPLPQDDVVINGSSGNISTTDVLILGKTVDFTGYTGTVTHTSNASIYTIFGGLTLASGMSFGATVNTFNLDFMGRSSYTITSNGKSPFPVNSNQAIRINAPSGTYTLGDAFIQSTPTTLTVSFQVVAGSFVTANQNMTVGRLLSIGAITRSVTLGSSTITIYQPTATSVIATASTGLTWSGASAIFTLSNAFSFARAVDLAGVTIGTFNYNVANSPGGLTISSSGTINTLNIGTGRLLTVTQNQTLTYLGGTLTGTNNGYVYMPGDGVGATTADSVPLSTQGDMDFRQRLNFDSLTPAGSVRIAAKYLASGNQRTWRLLMATNSTLSLDMSTTGLDSNVATASASLSSLGLSAGTNYWIRFTREKTTGFVKFYYAPDNASMPSTWTQIGTTQTTTTSNLFDSTAGLTIGGESGGLGVNFAGDVYWSQLRDNILDNGTGIQYDAVFSAKTFGVDSFTESSTNAATVTLNNLSIYGDGRLTIQSSTSTKAYLSKPSGGAITTADYLKIQDMGMVQPLAFFPGANSIDVSGNTGIYFTNSTYKHVQSTALANVVGTSTTVTFPTATTSGNLLIAYFVSSNSQGTYTPPSGWTLAKSSTSTVVTYIYYKIADGTETSVAFSQTTSRTLSAALVEYTGFAGTPTLDVTDSNGAGGASTSLSTTATTGPTNTAQPALALALLANVSTLGATVSLTNSFIEDRTLTNALTVYKGAVKELTTTAAVDTTFTWTTSRAGTAVGLVVFKDVSAGNPGSFLLFFNGF